jgi:Uma2 family endonuclease
MAVDEIVLPETKPETEWILGEPVQKMSPLWKHGLLQLAFGSALRVWAGGPGQVATEWRFRIAPPGECRRPLVPDVAYVALERIRELDPSDRAAPPFAPNVAVEILSPDDRRVNVDHKIAVYLAGGSDLVVVVDPDTSTVELHDCNEVRILANTDILTHPALPGFTLDLATYFREAEIPD